MEAILFTAWVLFQAFLFAVSVWFIVFGIRTWVTNRTMSIFILIFGFGGILSVIGEVLTFTTLGGIT